MSFPPKTNSGVHNGDPAGDPHSLAALYAQAAEVVRARSRTFHFATRFFPPDLARAAHAVYWYCSYTLSLAREAETPEQGHLDLDRWASLVSAGLRGRLTHHPVLEVFLESVDQCKVPHDCALELIEGARMDLDHLRYQSFSQLRGHCYRTSGMASVMMTHVVGFRGPAVEQMAEIGTASGLTSLLRRTGDDLGRGRIYLPLEEMEGFGYPESALRERKRNRAFHSLMQFQAERIREHFRRGEPGIGLLDQRGRFSARVAFDLSVQTLNRLESSGFDVFAKRPDVPAVERYWITARSMAGPITRRLWRSMGA
jgi:phytoene synthase